MKSLAAILVAATLMAGAIVGSHVGQAFAQMLAAVQS